MSGERLEVSVRFDERRGYVAKSACRATGPLPRPLARGRSITSLGGKIQCRGHVSSRSPTE
jgi:hypothetical protein